MSGFHNILQYVAFRLAQYSSLKYFSFSKKHLNVIHNVEEVNKLSSKYLRSYPLGQMA